MTNRIFKLPDIGEGVVEGEVVEWHVAVGDSVSEDDALVDVMTDKATVTIPSPHDGTIAVLHGGVGDMVAVGAALVEFGEGGDSPADSAEENSLNQKKRMSQKSIRSQKLRQLLHQRLLNQLHLRRCLQFLRPRRYLQFRHQMKVLVILEENTG